MYEHAIIACARWETPYIAEWIAYYDLLGFDRIYLYCNDDDPAELRAAVEAAPKSKGDLVSFTHFQGQGQQVAMYLSALETARAEAEWVAFLDIDEFLVLRNVDNIKSFMRTMPPDAESVHFNWVPFGNNGFAQRPPGSVLRQYTRRARNVDVHTKHLSRTSLLTPERLRFGGHPFWHGLSDPAWSDARRVNVLGKDMSALFTNYPANAQAYLANPTIERTILSTAWVNHYAFKSEADFTIRASRGIGGEFGGQAAWKREHDNGNFRVILERLNEVTDFYLRDLSIRRGLPNPGATPTQGEAAFQSASTAVPPVAWRTVTARHRHWTDDLLLGSNGRLRHAAHGSEADYDLSGNALHVRWDNWPNDLFIERDGIFVSANLPP